MAREVDRLLAGLAHLGTQPDRDARPPSTAPTPATAPRRSAPRVARSTEATTRRDHIALWARLLLGIVLGGVMLQWPYPHQCDLPLLGYLGAVATVMLTGAWIAFASWKLRSGLPHILSLILVFWGIVLAAEQLLPRIGYAADLASWRCPTELPVPKP